MMASHYIDQDLYGRGFDGIFGNEAEEEHIRSAIMTFRDMGDPTEFIDRDTSGRAIPADYDEELGNPLKRAMKRIRTIRANVGLKTFAKKTKAFVKRISGKRKHQQDFEEHDQSNKKDEAVHKSSPGRTAGDGDQNGLVEMQTNVPYEIQQELPPGETMLDVWNFVGDSLNQREGLIKDEEGEPHAEKDTSKESSPQAGLAFNEVIRSEEECLTRSTPRSILPDDAVASESDGVKAANAGCCSEVVTSDHEESPKSNNVNKVVPPSLGAAMGQDIKTSEERMEMAECTRVAEGSQNTQETFRPPQPEEMANVNALLEKSFQSVMNETTAPVERTSLPLRAALMTARLRSHITDFGMMLQAGSKNISTVIRKSIEAISQVARRMTGSMPFLQSNRRIRPRRMRFERFVLMGMRFTILRMMMMTQLIGEKGGGWLYILLLSGMLSWMVWLVSV